MACRNNVHLISIRWFRAYARGWQLLAGIHFGQTADYYWRDPRFADERSMRSAVARSFRRGATRDINFVSRRTIGNIVPRARGDGWRGILARDANAVFRRELGSLLGALKISAFHERSANYVESSMRKISRVSARQHRCRRERKKKRWNFASSLRGYEATTFTLLNIFYFSFCFLFLFSFFVFLFFFFSAWARRERYLT